MSRLLDHGWQPGFLDNELRDFINLVKGTNSRTSLFIDANTMSVQYAADIGFDRIEIYTGPFANYFLPKILQTLIVVKVRLLNV